MCINSQKYSWKVPILSHEWWLIVNLDPILPFTITTPSRSVIAMAWRLSTLKNKENETFFIHIIFYICDYILQPFVYRRDNLKHIETPNTALLLLILQVLLTLPQLLSPQMNNKNDSKRKKKRSFEELKKLYGETVKFHFKYWSVRDAKFISRYQNYKNTKIKREKNHSN